MMGAPETEFLVFCRQCDRLAVQRRGSLLCGGCQDAMSSGWPGDDADGPSMKKATVTEEEALRELGVL
jgi:hypothetical protein